MVVFAHDDIILFSPFRPLSKQATKYVDDLRHALGDMLFPRGNEWTMAEFARLPLLSIYRQLASPHNSSACISAGHTLSIDSSSSSSRSNRSSSSRDGVGNSGGDSTLTADESASTGLPRYALALFGAVGSAGATWGMRIPDRSSRDLYNESKRNGVPLRLIAKSVVRNLFEVNAGTWDVYTHCWCDTDQSHELLNAYSPRVAAAKHEDNRPYEAVYHALLGKGLWPQKSMGISISKVALLVIQAQQLGRRYERVVFLRSDALLIQSLNLTHIVAQDNLIYTGGQLHYLSDFLWVTSDNVSLARLARLPYEAAARHMPYTTQYWVNPTLLRTGSQLHRAMIRPGIELEIYRKMYDQDTRSADHLCRGFGFWHDAVRMSRDEWQYLVDAAVHVHELRLRQPTDGTAPQIEEAVSSIWSCLNGSAVTPGTRSWLIASKEGKCPPGFGSKACRPA